MSNQVYQTMLKNEQTRTVFGYSGHVSHGKIDTLPEWQAMDKQATAFINSLPDKKRITTIDKARTNNFLKAGYGLTAEALSSERANKFSSDWAVQRGFQAKLPFEHGTYNTAGDIFDAVTQEKMALDLASHTEAMQNNKLAYGSPKNNKSEIFGSKEIVSDADDLTFKSLPSMQVSEEQISSYVETLETEKSKVESSTSKFEHSLAPNFGVDNPMISSPGTPGNLASAIDQKNADNQQLIDDAKIHEAAKVGEQLKTAWKEGVKNFNELAAESAKNNEVVIDDTQKVGLVTIKDDENLEATASDVAIKSFETHEAVKTDEVLKVTASDEAVRNSLANSAEILKEREKERAIAAHNQFQNDRIDSIAKASDEAAKDAARDEFRKNRELGEKNYLLSGEKAEESAEAIAEVADEINTIGTGGSAVQTANANNEAKVKGLKEQEVLRVERKQAHNLGQDAFSGQGTDAVDPIKNQRGILDRINEERTGGDFEGRQFRQNQDLANSLDAEQKFSQMRNAQDQLLSEGPSTRGGTRTSKGKFRKLQAEKKAAAEAKRVAEIVDKKSNADNLIGHQKSGFKPKFEIARGSNDDPYHFSTLAYPPDAVNSQENGHFMLFYVNVQNKTKYEYKGLKNGQVVPVGDMVATPTFVDDGTGRRGGSGGGSKLITEYKPGAQAAGIAGPVEYQKQMIRNGGKGNIIYNNQTMLSKGRRSPGQNLNSKYPTTTRITDSVALYLPSGIGNSQSVSYGDFETGVAGYLTMSGLDVAKALQEDDFVGAATALFDKGGTLITDAIKKLALAGLETVGGGDGLQQNFDKIFGQTLNPYIEVAFQSSGMRTFDYTFKFAPKSKAETDEVRSIINLFRFHMLPEMKGTSHRYLTLPSTFDIHYMWQNGRTAAKENSFYNKIATCVLTNVNVNYTPNGEVQSFGDGAPTQIEMGLSFKETEMMTKQHVNEGF
jgi:hypothetical protein